MIKSHFQQLRRRKAYQENRDLSLRTIAAETGLSLGTVQRVSTDQIEKVYLSTLDTLCQYFNVKNVGELIEFVPKEP